MSKIKAGTTSTTAYQVEADTTGTLVLQTGATPTTALTLGTDQSATFAGAVNAPNTFGFKNRIINGAMVIDQRGASVSTGYSVDRFTNFNTYTSNFTFQKNAGSVTPPAGFNSYLGVTVGTGRSVAAGDAGILFQAIEGVNCADLAWGSASASAVTLSFWVRSSLTGTFGGAVKNNAGNRSYTFSFSISSANTWEYKTITIAGDTTGTWLTDTGKGIIVAWSVGSGSNWLGTSGSWAASDIYGASGQVNLCATTGATFYITGVQLEKGSTATSFDYRPYGTELQLCQRYYEQANFPVAGVCIYAAGSWQSNGNFTIPYKTVKRGSTSTTVSLAGNIDNCSSVSLSNDVYDSGLILSFTVTNASYPYMRANILYKASAEL